jgi:sec-independent protein translocase protein TatA
MLGAFEGWHIVIIVVVAAVLFGSGKLPGAARSMGQSLRIFKAEMKAGSQDTTTQASQIPAPLPVENTVHAQQVVTDTVPQNVTVQNQ